MTNRYGTNRLYICTVFCHVYILCTEAGRQPCGGILKEPPLYGWLAFNRPHLLGMPGEDAVLMSPEDIRFKAMRRLTSAWLHRIEGALVLKGSDGYIRKQIWVAALTADQAREVVENMTRKADVKRIYVEAQQEAERRARERLKESK